MKIFRIIDNQTHLNIKKMIYITTAKKKSKEKGARGTLLYGTINSLTKLKQGPEIPAPEKHILS
jgi:hypothetical protein